MNEHAHLVSAKLPTRFGQFDIVAFDSGRIELPHLVLSNLPENKPATINVRIHSECLTGDVFGSTRCDCGEQLDASLKYIQEHHGVVIYLRQEGRGIGLINKLKAYNLQDDGMDTVNANLALGFHADERRYDAAIHILNQLGISSINLLTNNPDKLDAFTNSGIAVVARIPLKVDIRPENENYILTKKNSMGHMF